MKTHRNLGFDRIIALADRRELMCKTSPTCPACETRQVQLIDYVTDEIEWKCRNCRTKFATDFNDH